jgi:hypothetical protein
MLRRTVVAIGVVLSVVVLTAGSASAWYSPINTDEYYAPPGPPGSNPLGTACRVDTMNGSYAGTAFAKLRMDNSVCVDATLYVVYQQGSGVANAVPASGASPRVWIQSQQPGGNVVGAAFYLEAELRLRIIQWSTSVFG